MNLPIWLDVYIAGMVGYVLLAGVILGARSLQPDVFKLVVAIPLWPVMLLLAVGQAIGKLSKD